MKHYIALVLSDDGCQEYTVKYMRRSSSNKFIFPNIDDISTVEVSDVVGILDQPMLNNRGQYMFSNDLNNYENLI